MAHMAIYTIGPSVCILEEPCELHPHRHLCAVLKESSFDEVKRERITVSTTAYVMIIRKKILMA